MLCGFVDNFSCLSSRAELVCTYSRLVSLLMQTESASLINTLSKLTSLLYAVSNLL